jgi:hypothetical protein
MAMEAKMRCQSSMWPIEGMLVLTVDPLFRWMGGCLVAAIAVFPPYLNRVLVVDHENVGYCLPR